MSTWLYQLNPQSWPPETFRYEIWEGKHWHWTYGQKRGSAEPKIGDTIVFFYAKSGGDDPGIYGWAVLERCHSESNTLYFIPSTPTNYLKMDPWWGPKVEVLVDDIRGPMKQATLFLVDRKSTGKIRSGIRRWLGANQPHDS